MNYFLMHKDDKVAELDVDLKSGNVYDVTGIISLKNLSPIIVAFDIKKSTQTISSFDYKENAQQISIFDGEKILKKQNLSACFLHQNKYTGKANYLLNLL